MAFAFAVIDTVRREQPQLFDAAWADQVRSMLAEAVECETLFADDVLSGGVVGLTRSEMRRYLEYVADQRLAMLGIPPLYQASKPLCVHGAAGCAGAHELLRATRLGLPGCRRRRDLLRRVILKEAGASQGIFGKRRSGPDSRAADP